MNFSLDFNLVQVNVRLLYVLIRNKTQFPNRFSHVTLKLHFELWGSILIISHLGSKSRDFVETTKVPLRSCLIVSKLKQDKCLCCWPQTHWPWSHLCGSTLPHCSAQTGNKIKSRFSCYSQLELISILYIFFYLIHNVFFECCIIWLDF